MRKESLSFLDSIAFIRNRHPAAAPNSSFVEQLKSVDLQLRKQRGEGGDGERRGGEGGGLDQAAGETGGITLTGGGKGRGARGGGAEWGDGLRADL
jgi:hypothetical protein